MANIKFDPNTRNYQTGAYVTGAGRMPAFAGGVSSTREGQLATWIINTTAIGGFVIVANSYAGGEKELTFVPAYSWIPVYFTQIYQSETVDGSPETTTFATEDLCWATTAEYPKEDKR